MTSEWKDSIKESFDEHNNRKAEIHSSLNKLLGELKMSPYNFSVGLDLKSEYPLTWEVRMGKRVISINDNDILNAQRIKDPVGYPTEKLGDLTESLKKLLVDKFS